VAGRHRSVSPRPVSARVTPTVPALRPFPFALWRSVPRDIDCDRLAATGAHVAFRGRFEDGLRPIGETQPIPRLPTVPADPPRQTEPDNREMSARHRNCGYKPPADFEADLSRSRNRQPIVETALSPN
jgi:hypothetical protein